MTHPSVLAYGLTYNKDFPIILVVGREPNNNTVSDYSFGHYDFRGRNSRCGFWNIAFKLLGSHNDLTTRRIKEKFIALQSSPIVFTDASSKGVFNIVNNKQEFRESVTKQEFCRQVEVVFSDENFVRRIKLIFLSGLSNPLYDDFKLNVTEAAKGAEIPVKEIPFLYGTNFRKIVSSLEDKEIQILKNVFEQFNQQETKSTD